MSRADRLRLAFAGMHPLRRAGLIERYGSARTVLDAIRRGAVRVPPAARRAALQPAHRCTARLQAVGVEAVMRGDPGYPEHLAGVPDAPDVLFVRGRLPPTPAVAVVGTRRCTRYGAGLAGAYGSALSEAGWPVASGLARGVDGAAHRAVVAAGGVGVAVLGSGSDVVYPPEHRGLHDALLDAGGAVITEYPPGVPPNGWRFPPRNRIISGLSAAVVVVEAPAAGGALVTAAAALDQGRPVFAVPGDVDREASRGCNLLIRDGAVPVLGPADLIEALSLVPALAAVQRGGPGAPRRGDPVVGAVGPAGATVAEIVESAGLPVHEVLARLTRLEVEGAVRRDGDLVLPGR